MAEVSEVPGAGLDQMSRGQPDAMERLLSQGWDRAAPALERFAEAERVWVAGIGTSFHAAAIGSSILREAGVEAHAVHSFDFAHYPPRLRPGDAIVIFSHGGSRRFSTETLESGRTSGVLVIAITGEESRMPEADLTLRTVPRDRSAAHTISYTSALTRLTQLAADRAARRGEPSNLLPGLGSIPDRMRAALALDARVQELARQAQAARMIHLVGGGPNAITAMEGALKLKEASYVLAEGMAVEQFIHGPIIAVEAADLGLLVNVPGPSAARLGQLGAALRGFGTPVVSIGSLPEGQDAANHLDLPLDGLPEVLTPLVSVVPLQRLALHLALARGVNPDPYRRNQPIYAAALEKVPL